MNEKKAIVEQRFATVNFKYLKELTSSCRELSKHCLIDIADTSFQPGRLVMILRLVDIRSRSFINSISDTLHVFSISVVLEAVVLEAVVQIAVDAVGGWSRCFWFKA